MLAPYLLPGALHALSTAWAARELSAGSSSQAAARAPAAATLSSLSADVGDAVFGVREDAPWPCIVVLDSAGGAHATQRVSGLVRAYAEHRWREAHPDVPGAADLGWRLNATLLPALAPRVRGAASGRSEAESVRGGRCARALASPLQRRPCAVPGC